MLVEEHAGSIGADGWKIIGTMGTVVLGLCAAIVKLCLYIVGEWNKSKAEDQAEIAQLRTVHTYANKKAESPK